MEGGHANARAAGGEDSHGVLANLERIGTEKKGDKTPQRTLPAQEPDRGQTEARPPLKQLRTLNVWGRLGEEGEEGPST